MKYNDSTPCEAISYGEVEDYTVNIAGAADITAHQSKLLLERLPQLQIYHGAHLQIT
jgi:hypothetical protein